MLGGGEEREVGCGGAGWEKGEAGRVIFLGLGFVDFARFHGELGILHVIVKRSNP
jgi:hypothetical protein